MVGVYMCWVNPETRSNSSKKPNQNGLGR